MNWLEKEVPSLELCQELKKLGYPQDGEGYYWIKTKEGWKLATKISNLWRIVGRYLGEKDEESIRFGGCHCCAVDLEIEEKIKASTCRELGEWLRQARFSYDGRYWRAYHPKADYNIYDEFEPNARAKMFIWLVKNKHISFKKERNA